MDKICGSLLRKLWLDYFEQRQHYVLESASLVPINDDSLLWINAGVATLKRFFTGQEIPACRRLTNSQRCLRTNDVDNVGLTSRHLTFFEMLGNFSVGDYFKKEAITFAYEFIFQVLKMDPKKIYVTVFEGDEQAYEFWKKLGISNAHLLKCSRERNFWDLGQGPCGPCTEIYFDRGEKYDPKKQGISLLKADLENDRYIEIWNIVFSEFNNDGHGNYANLVSKNIDTGAGFERLLSIIQDVPTNFDTDLFQPIIKVIEKYSDFKYVIDDYFSNDVAKHRIQQAFRIIADHFRAVFFAVSDGVFPENKERGYVIRKLVRRMVVFANKLNFNFTKGLPELVDVLVDNYADFYPFLQNTKKVVLQVLETEILNFKRVLKTGTTLLEKHFKNDDQLDGKFVFKLVETYGIPLEIVRNFCLQKQINFVPIEKEFDAYFSHHQELSRTINAKAMAQQNKALLELKVASIFDREHNHLESTCVALFDEKFMPVRKIDTSGYVVFDRTPFYATSGGQQHDVGVITKNGHSIGEINDVFRGPNLQHVHHVLLTESELEIDKKYVLSYDEQKRLAMQRNHTAEHLLQSTLKRMFSKEIRQEGAFKSHEKATFDFSYQQKLTDHDLTAIEDEIAKIIALDIQVKTTLVTLSEAKKIGALAYFEDRYAKFKQEKLRMVKIGEFSTEICGGTHTKSTQQVEDFYVSDYYSIGQNKWRIEVITGKVTTENYFQSALKKLRQLANSLKVSLTKMLTTVFHTKVTNLLNRLDKVGLPSTLHELREVNQKFMTIEKEVDELCTLAKKQNEQKSGNDLAKLIESSIENRNFVIYHCDDFSPKLIIFALKKLVNQYPDITFIVINIQKIQDTLQYFIASNSKNSAKINCQKIIATINKKMNGRGGGKDNFAQGGIKNIKQLHSLKLLFQREIQKCGS